METQGDRFDLDDTDYAFVEFNASDEVTAFLVTDNMHPKARKLPFGRSVEFTFQLVDDGGNPVAREGVEIRIRSRERNERRVVRDRTRTYETDSDGRVELSFRLPDPDPDDNDVDGTLDLDVLQAEGLEVIDETVVGVVDGRRLQWSDDEGEATALVLEQSAVFNRATDSGSGVRNRVTATLVDQYGDPIRGVRVNFVSNDDAGVGQNTDNAARNAYRKTTGSRGTATITYYRDSDAPATETINAFTDGKADIDAEPIEHYWVEDTPAGETITGQVVYHDDDTNTVVLKPDDAGPHVISYNSNDQFHVIRSVCPRDLVDGTCPVREDRVKKAEAYAEFRDGLKEGNSLEVTVGDNRNTVNAFTRNA